jgi:hypothetical protein
LFLSNDWPRLVRGFFAAGGEELCLRLSFEAQQESPKCCGRRFSSAHLSPAIRGAQRNGKWFSIAADLPAPGIVIEPEHHNVVSVHEKLARTPQWKRHEVIASAVGFATGRSPQSDWLRYGGRFPRLAPLVRGFFLSQR